MSLKSSHPPSLPSFASTFSTRGLSNLSSEDNSLPPIQTRSSISDFRRVSSPGNPISSRPQGDEGSSSSSRKRPRVEISGQADHDERSDTGKSSPGVKEEPEQDMLEPSPPPSAARIHDSEHSAAPPPSTLLPSPLKKRRLTVTGAPALDTNVRAPPDQSSSTPISPVLIGFTIQRDNPSAIEQVRSMISVKQQQQALIEQRRSSIVGISSPGLPAPAGDPPPSANKTSSSARPVRRSPNSASNNRRHANATSGIHPGATSPLPPTSQTPIVSSHPPGAAQAIPPPVTPGVLPSHSLPPPPISFARRRANQLGGAGKKKPADIVISPREAHTKEQLALSIQSAPPIPQGGQPGRFSMTIPRLPSVMTPGNANIQRPAGGKVPPTPTRFSVQRNTTSSNSLLPIPSIAGRSPPNASVPISSTLVPPTPGVLSNPGYSGERSAFLRPFEIFYDALNDSRELKAWLGDQMQRSNALMQNLTQQQDKIHDVVEALVEKKVSGMRAEIVTLRHKVDELEGALRSNSRRPSTDGLHYPGAGKGKQPLRNGIPPGPIDSYTFPPAPTNSERDRWRSEPDRRMSPGWGGGPDRDPRDFRDREREGSSVQDTDLDSAPSYDARRLSISASRLDPPRGSGGDGPFRSSPQQSLREATSSVPTLPPHPPPSGSATHNKMGGGPGPSRTRRPSITRQHSSPMRSGSNLPERPASSPPRRDEGSRRDRDRDRDADVSMES